MCKLYFIYYKGDIKSDKSMDICILIKENLNWSGGFFSRNFQPIEVHQFDPKRKQNVKYMKWAWNFDTCRL